MGSRTGWKARCCWPCTEFWGWRFTLCRCRWGNLKSEISEWTNCLSDLIFRISDLRFPFSVVYSLVPIVRRFVRSFHRHTEIVRLFLREFRQLYTQVLQVQPRDFLFGAL